jgi:alkylation response protein AidB-like acyl-CoA dehydrogenase
LIQSAHRHLTERVKALVPRIRSNAVKLDETAAFPEADIEALRGVGALLLPLPMGARDLDVDLLASTLELIGSGSLSVGRIFEAHVNALHLIERFGTPAQRQASRKGACEGELSGLWVTDPQAGALRMFPTAKGWRLSGGKMFCSGAGHVHRAIVTAATESGESQMLNVRLGRDERVQSLPGQLQGMRAAVTGMVDFTGVMVEHEAALGRPGDYLREPHLSCGAWRGSAVALGGLAALLDAATDDLRVRDRINDPHQLARIGRAMIARETCRLWVRSAAQIAEDDRADRKERVAYVGLARIAVESACLDAMRLIQRSMGLTAFRKGHAVELICRDLATYLRQPAPDEVLTEAASWYARRDQT